MGTPWGLGWPRAFLSCVCFGGASRGVSCCGGSQAEGTGWSDRRARTQALGRAISCLGCVGSQTCCSGPLILLYLSLCVTQAPSVTPRAFPRLSGLLLSRFCHSQEPSSPLLPRQGKSKTLKTLSSRSPIANSSSLFALLPKPAETH